MKTTFSCDQYVMVDACNPFANTTPQSELLQKFEPSAVTESRPLLSSAHLDVSRRILGGA